MDAGGGPPNHYLLPFYSLSAQFQASIWIDSQCRQVWDPKKLPRLANIGGGGGGGGGGEYIPSRTLPLLVIHVGPPPLFRIYPPLGGVGDGTGGWSR